MKQILLALVVLVSMAVLTSSNVRAQGSMSKNMTGPMVTIEGLKSATSGMWKTGKAESLEMAHFTFPKSTKSEASDGVMVVLPLMGTDEENIDSWKKSFELPAGKTWDDKEYYEVLKKKIGKADVTLIDIRGTYLKSPSDKLPKFRMFAVIFDVGGKKYLIRAIGPHNTMTRQKSDFRAFVASFK